MGGTAGDAQSRRQAGKGAAQGWCGRSVPEVERAYRRCVVAVPSIPDVARCGRIPDPPSHFRGAEFRIDKQGE
ncbi:hypothetical protein GCM10010295_24540 [Streptomyces intermedius]